MPVVQHKRRWCLLVGAILAAALYAGNASWIAPAPVGDPFIVAHRGLGQPYYRDGLTAQTCTAARLIAGTHNYLENTLPSIQAAIDLGATIVEFDSQPTADGHFVAFHDATLECRTEASGPVPHHRLETLQRLDIGFGYTADNGASWPFRGTGIGLMPTIEDLLLAFPEQAFLIDIKSGNLDDSRRLGRHIQELSTSRRGQIYVYGRPAAVAAVHAAAPAVIPLTRKRLKRCLTRYIGLGWTGHLPMDCRDTLLTIPRNVAPWLWGWPNRFLHRMSAAGSPVVLLDDYRGEGFSTPIDDPQILRSLPPGYNGGIWTDRIDLVAPALSCRDFVQTNPACDRPHPPRP